jgi:hypothetical protein
VYAAICSSDDPHEDNHQKAKKILQYIDDQIISIPWKSGSYTNNNGQTMIENKALNHKLPWPAWETNQLPTYSNSKSQPALSQTHWKSDWYV